MRLPLVLLTASLVAVGCAEETPSTNAPPGLDVVESHPGTLAISEPHRAAFIESTTADGDSVVIKGTGATKALTVGGQPADVASDGSFTAKVHAVPGLNIVAAVDGASRLETSFLFGHFVTPVTPIEHAISVNIGNRALNGALPDASLESILNLALEKRDLVYRLQGKSFSGEYSGVTWRFDVTNGESGPVKVALSSAKQGFGLDATITNVLVEGRLSMTSKAIDYTRGVKITVAKGNIHGDVDLAVDSDKGALTAAMPTATASIDGFEFDTDNAGFPCCVDAILTSFIQPRIQDALQEGIRTKVPEVAQLTLDGIGAPKKIDFAATGFKLAMPIAARFDGGIFDREGGTITASTMFGSDPKPGVPGWLKLGVPYAGEASRAPGVSVSVSLDAMNQLMYGAWTNGSLQYDAPAPLAAHLSASMPPVISITPEGNVRVGVGELLVQRKGADHALAAVSVQQDVAASSQGRSLVLTPKGAPVISVTWLADDSAGSGLNLVAQAAQDQVMKILKPFSYPMPVFSMDPLGGSLQGHALVIDSPAIDVDAKQQRIRATGLFSLIQ